ncbi:PEP-CTERM sorting domain-containing protein, partial [Acinetobacter baumannii]
EASTTAMMLGGLALVGFVALRRRRNEDSKSFAASQMTAA